MCPRQGPGAGQRRAQGPVPELIVLRTSCGGDALELPCPAGPGHTRSPWGQAALPLLTPRVSCDSSGLLLSECCLDLLSLSGHFYQTNSETS